MKRIGLFGGTFDPIHNGHLITVRKVHETRKLDKIILMPCNKSPLKRGVNSSSSDDRINMLKLAIDGIPYLTYSDYEIGKGDVSYTYDTVAEFKKLYDDIELIIGYDNLLIFDKWHKGNEIVKMAKLIILNRPLGEETITNNAFSESVTFVNTPLIEISATDIRNRVKNNLSIDFLVPDSVKKYIFDNNLYRK